MSTSPSHTRRAVLLAAVLTGLLVGSIPLAIGIGSANVPPDDTVRYLVAAITGGEVTRDEFADYQVVWQIRTPRVLLAAIVGAGLGAVGVAVQAMVRNALADPFILGVSSGASVGAVSVTVFGLLSVAGIHAVSVGAFLGALVASALVYLAAGTGASATPLRLVLIGVAMSFGFQAAMSVIVYYLPGNEATNTVVYWMMGSFGAAEWGVLPAVSLVVGIGIVLLRMNSRGLDVLSLGDETAASLGTDAGRLRRGLFVLAAVMTGAMVAVSGAIGFVGLVIPHAVRLLVGAAHSTVLILAPLLGAVFMVWVDLIARVLVAPRELPLGAITALIGVPVFVTLMRRGHYVFGGR